MQQSPLTIVGTLVASPTLKESSTGTWWTTLRLASTRRSQRDGVWSDASTCFLDVKVFGNLAKNVGESFHQGDELICVGHLQTDQWTTAEEEKRSKTVMVADSVGGSASRCVMRMTKVQRATTTTEDSSVDLEAVAAPDDASELSEDGLVPTF